MDPEVVDLFFARVMGDETEVVTADNAEQLQALCDELGFSGFDGEIRAVLGDDVMTRKIRVEIRERLEDQDVRLEDQDLRLWDFWEALGTLDERVNEIASQLLVVLPSIEARLSEVVRAVRDEFPERLRAVEEVRLNEGAVAEARREAGALREDVARLRSELGKKASAEDVAALQKEVARLKEAEARPTRSERRRKGQAAGKVTEPVETKFVDDKARPPPPKRPAPHLAALVGTEFVYDKARPLDGIIARLTRECGGNVHEQGVIEVTASSGGTTSPENAVDLESFSEFWSQDSPNSWICYDFGGLRVTLTSYTIKSADYSYRPKSWVLEVSNDGSEGSWAVVDSREDNEDLDDEYATRNFAISAPPSGAFRFVRLRQTGKNHCGNNQLVICGLELFGTLSGGMPRPVAAPGEFPFWDMQPLEGIIAHLTRECDGNVHEKGVIDVTASSCHDGRYTPENVVDLGSDLRFFSKDSPNSWICYDFKGRRVPTVNPMSTAGDVNYPPFMGAVQTRDIDLMISRLTLRTKTDRLKSLSLSFHVMRTIRSSSTNSLSVSTKHS